MYILGLESSCDETSAAVVEMSEGVRKIKSNIIASQIDTHRLYGGVVPEIASRAHIEAISRITYEALEEAGVTLKDIGLVAVTSHPGLIGALLVGVNFAKSLAFSRSIPLIASQISFKELISIFSPHGYYITNFEYWKPKR